MIVPVKGKYRYAQSLCTIIMHNRYAQSLCAISNTIDCNTLNQDGGTLT